MLKVDVLGRPAEDNALWATLDGGQSQTRLLLDCGAGTLDAVPFGHLQAVDAVLFSHLHMDHVGGFDSLFRALFDRPAAATAGNQVWGPPGTARILSHRFRGYWWNHAPELRGVWHVHDVHEHHIHSYRFEAHEAFEVAHDGGQRAHGGLILETPQFSVEALPLHHHGVSLGYVVREAGRMTVNTGALAQLGLKPGAWLAQLKAGAEGILDVNGVPHDAAALKAHLLQQTPGQSFAYLTDFLLTPAERERLAPRLAGVQTLYLEAQYLPEDAALAERHQHTTVEQGAALAAAAGVEQLVLLHLSRRYRPERWPEFLAAARAIFPATNFPAGWPDEPDPNSA